MSLAGWTVVEDSPDGSLLLQAPNGQRRRCWSGQDQMQKALAMVHSCLEHACDLCSPDNLTMQVNLAGWKRALAKTRGFLPPDSIEEDTKI